MTQLSHASPLQGPGEGPPAQKQEMFAGVAARSRAGFTLVGCLAFALGVGSRYTFTLFALFRGDELPCVFIAAYYLLDRRNPSTDQHRTKQLTPVVSVLAMWLIAQLVSDVVNAVPYRAALQGLGGILLLISSLVAYWYFFTRNRGAILFYFIGATLGGLLFNPHVDATAALLRSEFWDLRVAIWGGPLLCATVVVLNRRAPYLAALGMVAYGAAAIAYGARAHGVCAVLAGIAAISLKRRPLAPSVNLTGTALRYAPYAFLVLVAVFLAYVSAGLAGFITPKAKDELSRLQNPYNPIDVITASRSTVGNGFRALMARPILGYGSKGDTFSAMRRDLNLAVDDYNLIHSCLMEAAANCGIIGAVTWLALLIFVVRGIEVAATNQYSVHSLVLFIGLNAIWAMLFSPLASARLFLPPSFAIISAAAQRWREGPGT